jgi:Kef-type K+ transport system membrane component KefB
MLEVSSNIPFIVQVFLLLLLARVLGELMERFNQPSMIGELLAGVILGPSLLGVSIVSPYLKAISDLGVLLLVILAGLEIDINELKKSVKGRNFWIAILGFTVPLLSGLLLGVIFKLNFILSVFLALCISITALPVSVRILMDIGKLNTDIGRRIISTAIFNDVVALLILGVVLDTKEYSDSVKELSINITISVLKVVLFMFFMLFAYKILEKTKQKMPVFNQKLNMFLDFLKGKESLFAIVMVYVLIFSSIAELVGLHFVIGAFFGAILLPREMLGVDNFKKVKQSTSSITIGFLAPIFFAFMGVEFSFKSISNYILLLSVILASFISKILGGYIGGRLANFNKQKSLAIGIGLNARGIMELVIANIALQNKFIDISMFSILVLMGLITTMVTPFLLKTAFKKIDAKKYSKFSI